MNKIPDQLLLWAKTSDDDSFSYHPLLFHSLDIAAIAEELLTKRMAPAKRKFAANLFINEITPYALELIVFLVSLHDIGKASQAFQNKNRERRTQLERSGFKFISHLIETPEQRHNFFSEFWIKNKLEELTGAKIEKNDLGRIAKSIGGHHGKFSTDHDLIKYTAKLMGIGKWEEARDSIARDLFKLLIGDSNLKIIKLNNWIKPIVFQYWFTGFITLADWIASMPEYFPYAVSRDKGYILNAEEYWILAKQKAKIALDKCGFPLWRPQGEIPSFEQLFSGFTPREQQSEVFRALMSDNSSGDAKLLIVEAPMGIGKTEMAFYASEYMNLCAEQTGVYIGMPTRATSNQMFLRYRNFLSNRFSDEYSSSLELLHSASQLFLEGKAEPGYTRGIHGDDDVKLESTLISYDWFRPKKRGLLAPFAVGTIDQILISILNTKHNYLRLYGLNAKTIILDEVHSYDVYMSGLLEGFLKWAGRININVILLSATLPKNKRTKFVEAFTGEELKLEANYPRFTLAARKSISSYPLSTTSKKTIKIARVETEENQHLIEFIYTQTNKGACTAVICNTVGKAQELYRLFKELSCEEQIPCFLLHARFPAHIRNKIEEKVISLFGRTGKRPVKIVLFSTQIIEQSLDIDFDLMITELAPVDLFIQRLGRLRRFEIEDRKTGINEPLAYWFNHENKNFSKSVYDGYILYRSFLTLSARNEINIPEGVEYMIEEVYSETNHPYLTAPDQKLYEGLKIRSIEKSVDMESKVAARIIPGPDEDDTLFFGISLLDDDDPQIHEDIQAATRLGDPAVRVVCVLRNTDDFYYADESKTKYEPDILPTKDLEMKIMQAVVQISSRAIRKYLLNSEETKPPANWKKNSLLRHLRVVIFENNIHIAENYQLIFDYDSGIIISKINKE
ncbi:MAG: CRISPR-associated helicase Cas3' [Ignavibacteriales bacterium]|nr:CRISPR-associated helicase Cas3' [Ignavibacteriales bacterium]MCF8315322.1 CRISPR-associated helicase Cas3' [Ignavibacteriales bacterium]MCF8436786.1 CRISPR-associated helicase Cas3' [Ignavibacteriales bacterium]